MTVLFIKRWLTSNRRLLWPSCFGENKTTRTENTTARSATSQHSGNTMFCATVIFNFKGLKSWNVKASSPCHYVMTSYHHWIARDLSIFIKKHSSVWIDLFFFSFSSFMRIEDNMYAIIWYNFLSEVMRECLKYQLVRQCQADCGAEVFPKWPTTDGFHAISSINYTWMTFCVTGLVRLER